MEILFVDKETLHNFTSRDRCLSDIVGSKSTLRLFTATYREISKTHKDITSRLFGFAVPSGINTIDMFNNYSEVNCKPTIPSFTIRQEGNLLLVVFCNKCFSNDSISRLTLVTELIEKLITEHGVSFYSDYIKRLRFHYLKLVDELNSIKLTTI